VTERRFPPPWSVEELEACFVLPDANGEVLAYVYCEEAAAKLLGKARRAGCSGGLGQRCDARRRY
jgi:hypothetical protein